MKKKIGNRWIAVLRFFMLALVMAGLMADTIVYAASLGGDDAVAGGSAAQLDGSSAGTEEPAVEVDEPAVEVDEPAVEVDEGSPLLDAAGHFAVRVAAKSETCTEVGNREYYYCSECEKFFSDAACTVELTADEILLPATGHEIAMVEAAPATCTELGNREYYVCTKCDKIFGDAEGASEISESDVIIDATGHTLDGGTVTRPATCGTEGEMTYHCSVCGGDVIEIIEPTDDHSWDEGKITALATASENAQKTYTCTVCGVTATEAVEPPEAGTKLVFPNAVYKVTKQGSKVELVSMKASGKVKIPATVMSEGITYKVASVGSGAFKKNKKITSVILSKNVTAIKSNAFAGCTALKKVTLVSGIKTIGKGAFQNCSVLRMIIMPRTVEKIGANAFQGCEKLRTVAMRTGVTTIGEGAFSGCTALECVNIPKTVTAVGAGAFLGDTRLAVVTIGAGLKTIGEKAFYGCSRLVDITIQSKVLEAVGDDAFAGIRDLAVISVKSEMYYKYEKLLAGKGQGRTTVYTTISWK